MKGQEVYCMINQKMELMVQYIMNQHGSLRIFLLKIVVIPIQIVQ